MIRTHALTKRFGKVLAVDGVDLDVHEGDVYGFLGANGSGKTTTVRMLLGLVLATSGTAEVLGEPMPRRRREVLPLVGALVEGPGAYDGSSGRVNLRRFDAMGPAGTTGGRRTRRSRVEDALERVGLGGVDDRPVRAYSLGMRQRLGLAAALLRGPRLLVLDEPTNGLDPQGIGEIRDLLGELNRAGTTVFLSSHLLAEVEQMCTRVGVLDRGRLVLQDELASLRGPTGRQRVATEDAERAVRLLGDAVEDREDPEHPEGTGDRGGVLLVRSDDPAGLNHHLVAAGCRVTSLTPERRTLEDVVLEASAGSGDRVDAGRARGVAS